MIFTVVRCAMEMGSSRITGVKNAKEGVQCRFMQRSQLQ